MTLEEAIKRYTSNAFYEKSDGNLQGYLEFNQLAEWLEDYKLLLEQENMFDKIRAEIKTTSLNVIEEIKTEIENSSCGSWYVKGHDGKLEKEVLLRMVDVLGIIDKKVKEYSK